MKELIEVTWKDEEEAEPVWVKEKYYLLHFGLKYQLIETENGNIAPVSYTVCICQSVKTGQLEYFDAGQIRVIGTKLEK